MLEKGEKRVPAPVRPPTMAEAALLAFRDQLLKGELGAGDAIKPEEAAEGFGMSALPVREALRVLIAEGWVEYEPHRGYWVKAHSLDDVAEIFLMCRLLEAEALRRGVPVMGAAGAARMEALLVELESMPERGQAWQKVVVHRDFHFVPIEYARLPRLEAELRRLWDHTDHYRGLHFFADESPYAFMRRDHRTILEACAAGDPDRVVRLMDEHRDHALQIVAAAIEAKSLER
jgi:DNA-binding GntR family transcriptional regulator